MKTNALLMTLSLGLLTLGCQTLTAKPSGAESVVPPSPPASPSQRPPLRLPVASSVPLPRLSKAEIKALQTELTQGINTWFGLAGLAKMPPPPPLSKAIQDYRRTWSRVNVDLSTFAGSWQSGDDYPYSVTIFPSKTPGRVCVLEFRPENSLQIFNEVTGQYGKDVISEQLLSFSIATLQNGSLRSSQIRSVGSATAVARYTVGKPYSVSFMSLMDKQGTPRVVALAAPPTLPTTLPEGWVAPISQALATHGCTTDLTPKRQ